MEKNIAQSFGSSLRNLLPSIATFIRYNAIHVFAGKFIYFLGVAIALFLTIVIIYVLEESTPPGAEAIYYFLLTPAVLLLFYPSAYTIQTDTDSGMIETLFGIPDYRYKVWMMRYATQYLIIFLLLALLGFFCRLTMADFPFFKMIFQLMFPVIFLSSLSFMISTITRSGNGAAVIMVVIFLTLWTLAEPLDGSRWDLFHNPFAQVDVFETYIWQETTFYNRIYLLAGSILSMMFALLRLQKREKFI